MKARGLSGGSGRCAEDEEVENVDTCPKRERVISSVTSHVQPALVTKKVPSKYSRKSRLNVSSKTVRSHSCLLVQQAWFVSVVSS